MDYVFPKSIANFMANISQKTQFEAGMLSIVFILIGIIFFAIVSIIYSSSSLFTKIMIGINAVAAIVLLGSHLVTTYQQYKNYKEVMGLYNEISKDTNCKEVIKNEKGK